MSGWTGLEALLTAEEVAELLRCSPRTVGRLRRAGKLPGVLVGRAYMFSRAAVEEFIEGGGK